MGHRGRRSLDTLRHTTKNCCMRARIWTDASGAVLVPIERLNVGRIETDALRRHEYWITRSDASYQRRSTVAGQEAGVLGEHAVAAWLSDVGLQVRMIADDPASRRAAFGDVATSVPNSWPPTERTLEVKTQRHRDWRRGGPVMNFAQLYRYEVPVAWCVVADDRWSAPVRIIGWFHPAEIRNQMSEGLFDETFGNDGIHVWPEANGLRELVDLLRAPEREPPTADPFA